MINVITMNNGYVNMCWSYFEKDVKIAEHKFRELVLERSVDEIDDINVYLDDGCWSCDYNSETVLIVWSDNSEDTEPNRISHLKDKDILYVLQNDDIEIAITDYDIKREDLTDEQFDEIKGHCESCFEWGLGESVSIIYSDQLREKLEEMKLIKG